MGVRGQEAGDRSQVTGVRKLVKGVRCQEAGSRRQVAREQSMVCAAFTAAQTWSSRARLVRLLSKVEAEQVRMGTGLRIEFGFGG